MAKELGKPESSSDVVNKEPQVLLIGYGWVGQYMGKYFKSADYITSEGIYRAVATNEPVRSDKEYDLAIIGVPTPMNHETGQCDTSIVEEAVAKHRNRVRYFLIKSTVEIGTSERLARAYQTRVAMSPEYVGETLGHPLLEPRRDAFQIIGGAPSFHPAEFNRADGIYVAEKIANMFQKVLHASAPFHLCTSTEAEIIKYCENMWIMQRVDYWNDVYEIAKTFGVSFQQIREGIVLDPRMGRTHSFVYEDNRGWSGKCLPKDMNALAHKMRTMGNPLPILEHQIEKNNLKWRKGYLNNEKLIPNNPIWAKSVKTTGFDDPSEFSNDRGNQKV